MTFPYAQSCRRLLPVAAVAAVLLSAGPSQAAFTVKLNGTEVAVDGGLNDSNPLAGVLEFDQLFDGYRVRFTGNTTSSTPTAGSLQTSELQILRQATGASNLVVSVTESAFQVPVVVGPGTLSTTLTRNTVSPNGTSGTVSLTSTALDLLGNTASASTITLTANPTSQASGNPATAAFNRQTQQYSLTSQITVSGLLVSDGVQITTDAVVVSAPLVAVPAPAPVVMLLSALPAIGLVRRLRRRAA